jgi:hypothetical protein
MTKLVAMRKQPSKLAIALQHKRPADFRTATLNAESNLSIVNLLAVMAGSGRTRPSVTRFWSISFVIHWRRAARGGAAVA